MIIFNVTGDEHIGSRAPDRLGVLNCNNAVLPVIDSAAGCDPTFESVITAYTAVTTMPRFTRTAVCTSDCIAAAGSSADTTGTAGSTDSAVTTVAAMTRLTLSDTAADYGTSRYLNISRTALEVYSSAKCVATVTTVTAVAAVTAMTAVTTVTAITAITMIICARRSLVTALLAYLTALTVAAV
jgi:hypothetical protein